MATSGAVAKMRYDAQERIVAALENKIDDRDKVEALKLSQLPSRDPEYQQARQLELIADILEELPESVVAQAAKDAKIEESADKMVEDQAEANDAEEQSDQRPHDEPQLSEEEIREKVKDNDPLAPPSAAQPAESSEESSEEGDTGLEALSSDTRELLESNGYADAEAVKNADDGELLSIKGIGQAKLDEIRTKVG